jgi:RNA ligase (TIGR02306 family)
MSNLIIPVAAIEKLTPHNNADSLELAQILGWQMVVRKDEYTVRDAVVYFPIDTVLPLELSDRFNVTKYLSKGRIRCTKLRGEPSFGLAVRPDNEEWQVGQDVAEHYASLGVKKYEPPVRVTAGDAETEHPLFITYTEIENMRNFPDIFQEGEMVVLTEKVHGTNSRVGIIEGVLMAGSKGVRRKRPVDDKFEANLYWYPLSLSPVRSMLEDLATRHRQVVLFGEIYGSKIQSLDYGHKGTMGYRAFDLLIDGKYLNWPDLLWLCVQHGVDTVPVVTAITFDLDAIKAHSEGNTLLMDDNAHIREGLVVKPFQERRDPKLGRCVLKYVSDAYLFGKQSDFTDQ